MKKKMIYYFAGCTANFMEPNIGRDTIHVLEQNGFMPVVPAQKCCGTPLISLGDKKSFLRNAHFNLKSLSEGDYDIVTSCTSCALTLKHDYPNYIPGKVAQSVADRTYDSIEYLSLLKEKGMLNSDFSNVDLNVTYHTPCHLKVLGDQLVRDRLKIVNMVPGVTVTRAESGCCGMGGTFGMKKDNYDISMEIGSPLFKKIYESGNGKAATDCPTCKLQIEQGTKADVLNPIEIISKAYGKSQIKEKR